MFSKLGIVLPWDIDIPKKFFDSFMKMVKPRPMEIFRGEGTRAHLRHERACASALKKRCSHIAILGVDQTYPADILNRLLNHHLDVVTALVPMGKLRMDEMKRNGTKPYQAGVWANVHEKPDGSTGGDLVTHATGDLVEIDLVGTGCLVFESKILNKIPRPWFMDEYLPGSAELRVLQDINFCIKIRKAGYKIWCDTVPKIKHIREFEIDETFSARFADDDGKGHRIWLEEGLREINVKDYIPREIKYVEKEEEK